MTGFLFGNRCLRITGKGFFYEKVNDLYCEISAGKDKKKVYESFQKLRAPDLIGGIFKVTNSFGKKVISMDMTKNFDGVKHEDIIEKYSQLTGKWYGDLYFDGVPYKTVAKGPFPNRLERQKFLLPSDSLFREDIVFRKWNKVGWSNDEK
ncbi:unnamed protein product [Sphagnum balticum]